MKPIWDLLDAEKNLHFTFRGYDQEPDKLILPLFIEIRDGIEKVSICIDFDELRRKMFARQRQIILTGIDYPDYKIRIIHRLRHKHEDGGEMFYTELTIQKGSIKTNIYVAESQFAFKLGAMQLTIAARLPAPLAA